jgi:aldose 1-epimerase
VTVRRADFGALENGAMIEAVELSNRSGVTARIITLGAAVQSLATPDRNGRTEDIVLGYASAR